MEVEDEIDENQASESIHMTDFMCFSLIFYFLWCKNLYYDFKMQYLKNYESKRAKIL
jgi:hypothetical protein